MDSVLESLATSSGHSHAVVSPAGDRIAFYSDRSGRSEIWLFDIDTETLTQVSDGEVADGWHQALLWDKEGKRLFFDQGEAGDRETDIYSITLDRAVQQLTDIDDRRCTLQDVSPDDRYLLLTTDREGRWDLRRHDLRTGNADRLTEIVWSNHIAGFSPDGCRIAYPAPTTAELQYDEVGASRELGVADADGGNARVLDIGTPGEEVISRTWHPDGDRLFVTCTGDRTTRHGLYDLTDDTVEWLGTSDIEEKPVTYHAPSRSFIVVQKRELSSVPKRYPLDGDPETLALPDGVIEFPPVISSPSITLATGEILVGHATPTTSSRLLHYDLETDEYATYLDGSNTNGSQSFVDATEVSYESSDGLEIHGLLYDSGARPSPVVVRVKGGPDGRITKRFDPFVQLLVANGYSVLEPNYRGSEGRGRAFRQQAFGGIGDGDAADVASAARWLAAQDWIDGDRIAVYGHSHGAYLVYMVLVTYPTLWAAGIAWNGFTDYLALDEHAAGHASWLLGDREENEALWRERSPITHVDEIERPILIFHAENDWIPITQARRFRDALEARGWTEGDEFRYVELSDQGHYSDDPEQLKRRWEIILDFLETRV